MPLENKAQKSFTRLANCLLTKIIYFKKLKFTPQKNGENNGIVMHFCKSL